MATPFFSTRYFAGAFATVAAAALLASCSGSQAPLTPTGGQSLMPQVKNRCVASGGVRVTPCRVDLTASKPGPDTVTVRLPQDKKGTLSEQDNCGGASGIATVTQSTSDSAEWIVTAGGQTGSCTATFDYNAGNHGKLLGYAKLKITNSI